jgi:hypothetical protein
MKSQKKPKLKSKFEEKIYELLRRRLDGRGGVGYETTTFPYVTEHRYRPDFHIQLPGGREFFVESKGYFRPSDRTLLKAVRDANPRADIRLVFQGNSKIHRDSSMRYSDWCEKNGFMYAIGDVPDEWLT